MDNQGKLVEAQPGLGRVPNKEDIRDRAFPFSAAPALAEPLTPLPTYRYYPTFYPPLNQGGTSQCPVYAEVGDLYSSPVRHPRTFTPEELTAFYRRAQQLDDWPGEEPSYYGTSLRAACKALQEAGLITSYYWATAMEDIIRWLLLNRPLCIGINWYTSFDKPADDVLTIPDGATVRGGHAVLLYGISTARKMVRMQNSWGPGYASFGRAWIPFDVLERLIFREGGDAVGMVEVEP